MFKSGHKNGNDSLMPSVLHIIQTLNTGGAARVLLGLAKYSDAKTIQHRVLSLSSVGEEALALAAEHNVPVSVAPGRNAAFAEIERADIVQFHWWNSPHMGALLSESLPPSRMVCWYHVGGEIPPQRIPERLMDYFDVNVACSEHTFGSTAFQKAARHSGKDSCLSILAAMDPERFEKVQPVAHSGFVVGYNGTVHYQKMHPAFIRMAERVKTPGAKFVVSGAGDIDKCEEEAAQRGVLERFEFLGYVSDVAQELAQWDVFGYPLCEDTYAAAEVALQEAMYCGLPPVIFPYGGGPYLVQDEETGLVVSSEEEYVEALDRLGSDAVLRKRLGAEARAYAKQNFLISESAKKWARVYGNLMRSPKREREAVPGNCVIGGLSVAGAERFVDSLGDARLQEVFLGSAGGSHLEEMVEFDKQIGALSELMHFGGVLPYLKFYPEDPLLSFWHGLGLAQRGQYVESYAALTAAESFGLQGPQIEYHLARVGVAGNCGEPLKHLKAALSKWPEYEPLQKLRSKLGVDW